MDTIVLSEKIAVSTDMAKTHLNNNICIVGCTGSGKTTSFIEPRLLKTFDTNLIIYDPKRELIEKYRGMFEERGNNVWEINLSSPQDSDVAYDPIKDIKSDEDIIHLSDALVNLIPQRDNSSADKFWEKGAAALNQMGIYYKISTKEDCTFADVLDFLCDELTIEDGSASIRTSIDQQIEMIKKNHPGHPVITPYNSLKILPIKTAGCVFSELRTTLTNVFTRGMKEAIRNKPALDIQRFASEKSVLFITASSSNNYLDAIVNLIFNTCLKQLQEIAQKSVTKQLPIPVHLIMDDFACGSIIKSFPKDISRFRSFLISVTIVLQSRAQLEGMYGICDATTITDNCDTTLFLGSLNKETCKYYAEMINVPLEKVLYMPLGNVIVIRRGSPPSIDKRYPTLEDKEYKRIAELNRKRRNDLIHATR